MGGQKWEQAILPLVSSGGEVNERMLPVERNMEGYCAKAGVVQPSDTAVCSCILRSMASYTSDTANERVVTSGHTHQWLLKPQCESSKTLLCFLLPHEFLAAVAIFPLSLSFHLICMASAGGKRAGQPALPCLERRNEAGKPDRTNWLMSLSSKGSQSPKCGLPVSPEQLPWLPLFWRILIFIIFTVPFPPFFAVCTVSSPCLGSERQSYKLA